MDVEKFFEEFKIAVDDLWNEETFKWTNKCHYINDTVYTFLFNFAVYNIVKKYKLGLKPEEKAGRGGYSDMTICSPDGKEEFIEIEHENRPLDERNGVCAIHKSLDNLQKSNACHKILITYTFDNITEDKLIKLCMKHLNNSQKKEIYLFYAPDDYGSATKEFKKVRLPKD